MQCRADQLIEPVVESRHFRPKTSSIGPKAMPTSDYGPCWTQKRMGGCDQRGNSFARAPIAFYTGCDRTFGRTRSPACAAGRPESPPSHVKIGPRAPRWICGRRGAASPSSSWASGSANPSGTTPPRSPSGATPCSPPPARGAPARSSASHRGTFPRRGPPRVLASASSAYDRASECGRWEMYRSRRGGMIRSRVVGRRGGQL